jgi:ribosomal protein L31
MIRSTLLHGVLCAFALASTGCNLLRTEDDENVAGRGSKAFDPYAASASGAIRLSLQSFNGCAVLPTGKPVAKGTANIPYPTECSSAEGGPAGADPDSNKVAPTHSLKLVSGTTYFLHQFTLMDTVVDRHTDPKDMTTVSRWMRTESRLQGLDWSGLGVSLDEWSKGPVGWVREVHFANATWMQAKDDTFKVEVLDTDGVVRNSMVYDHKDFFGSSSVAGHSRVSWRMENVDRPQFPGDLTPHAVPGADAPPTFRTTVRVDLVGSTNPFKTFRVEGLKGDGAIRVTWSQLPDAPFYFPVTFVNQADLPSSCKDASGKAVPCGFGVDPELQLTTPRNGKGFYEPGETFDLLVQLKDGDGNLLHTPGQLPTYREMFDDQSNGLTYYTTAHNSTLLEADIDPGVQVLGPLQNLTTWRDTKEPAPYFKVAPHQLDFASPLASLGFIPGLLDVHWPSRLSVSLPPDAKPGTYVALVKANRSFMGERIAKIDTAFFQVGQEAPTSYPGKVGNCQICHRGVLSLDNLRHGLSVDHVESCKGCHTNEISREIHQIHVRSEKFRVSKAECTVCHLSRESAVRPSVDVCSSCHPSVHGNQYFETQFSTDGTPNRFGNCAQSCHVNTVPNSHILPPN